MKIYCINLDRSPGRLAHMSQTFAMLELPFTRFSAVDGAKIAREIPAGRLTPGELGCMRSHRAVWQEISAGDAPIAAVFEDDIHVSSRLKAFLDLIDQNGALPDGADLLKIETMGTRVLLVRPPVAMPGAIALHRLVSSHLGTAGYLVSRAAAGRLAALLAGEGHTADQIFDAAEMLRAPLHVLQAVPALVVQDMYAPGAKLQFGSVIDAMSAQRKATRTPLPAKISREIRRGGAKAFDAILWRLSSARRTQMRLRVGFDAASGV